MRPFDRLGGRSVSLDGPEFELREPDRGGVDDTLRPYLRDPATLEDGLARTEDAIRSYVFWERVHAQTRPGSRQAISDQLGKLSRAAAAYLAAAAALNDEARQRLAELWTPDSPTEEDIFGGSVPSSPRYGGYPVDPDRLNASLRTTSLVVGVADLVAAQIAEERRKRGPRGYPGARPAVERLADFWVDLTGRTLHPKGGDENREGYFLYFVRAAIRTVEPGFDGRSVVREVAERRAKTPKPRRSKTGGNSA